MKIKVLNTHTNKQGYVPLTWEFENDEETKQFLNECIEYNRKLVIVTRPSDTTGRCVLSNNSAIEIANLQDKVKYISFLKPGLNDVYVLILPNSFTNDLHNLRINKDTNQLYHTQSEYYYYITNICKSATCQVDINNDAFTTEPSQFEQEWVNYYFKKRATNTCSFNKRRILAYTLQPFTFLLEQLIKIIWFTILFLLVGIKPREFNFKLITNPLTNTLVNSSWAKKEYFISTDRWLKIDYLSKTKDLVWFQLAINCLPTLILMYTICWGLYVNAQIEILQHGLAIVLIFSMVVIAFLICGIMFLLFNIYYFCVKKYFHFNFRKNIVKQNTNDSVIQELLRPISTYADLSTSQKIKLFLQTTKSKTCKRFLQ